MSCGENGEAIRLPHCTPLPPTLTLSFFSSKVANQKMTMDNLNLFRSSKGKILLNDVFESRMEVRRSDGTVRDCT